MSLWERLPAAIEPYERFSRTKACLRKIHGYVVRNSVAKTFVCIELQKEGQTMKEKRSQHLKVQELIDCFATTDPLREMSVIAKEKDLDEAALKWLALAVLHGVNFNAKKITLSVAKGGEVAVTAKYRKAELPSPGAGVGARVIDAVRQITHFQGEKEKGPLAIGVRNDSLELRVGVERDARGDTVVLKFPKLK
jgi:hypothetical protein